MADETHAEKTAPYRRSSNGARSVWIEGMPVDLDEIPHEAEAAGIGLPADR